MLAMAKAHILVVDDDKSIVKVVRSYLEQAGYDVSTALDGEHALHLLRSERPDLMVLDLMLPDRDGWEITRIVRNDQSLGADDYVTKPFNSREIVARVRALLRRVQFGRIAPPPQLRVGSLVLDPDQHSLTVDDKPIELTRTEFTLLHVLMSSVGHTFTRDELLEKTMGYAYEGMGRTLDTHISNLRKKIEPDPGNPTYIQTVYGVGYRMSKVDA
jgi:DNA-binding response OmpR family regulator